jgi:quercetin dioxygenase-like cupin family protein
LIIKTIRAPGTRAPIHEHEFSGTTTVVQGEMTLYMDGHAPVKAVQGQSYFMPSGHRMTGVNTGHRDAVLFDTYVLPPFARHWRPVEPGFVECLGTGKPKD